MNKVLLAVLVAVCAATILEMATARSHEHRRPKKRGNCSTNGDNFEVNERCAKSCWKKSNGTQFGSCQNGNCTCMNRNSNGTAKRSIELFQLPTFEAEPQRKDKNPLFG